MLVAGTTGAEGLMTVQLPCPSCHCSLTYASRPHAQTTIAQQLGCRLGHARVELDTGTALPTLYPQLQSNGIPT